MSELLELDKKIEIKFPEIQEKLDEIGLTIS